MNNRFWYYKLILLSLALSCSQITSAQIYINEFMASNDATISDEAGEFEDWVEVYNAGNTPVNLAGYYWTDDLAEPTLSQIPSDNAAATTVPAGGFLLFWFDKDLDQGTTHVNAKLGAGGEDLALFAADGATIIDSYTFGEQLTDVSEGRVPDGGASFDFYNEPTPNATNDTEPGAAMADKPTVNLSGGHHSGSITLTLNTPTPDASIYYTLDGSVPTTSSIEYTSPITITTTTSLRARTILAPLTDSEILTETYLIDISHDFPIVTLAGNPDDFFGPDGIVTNFEEDLEIPVNAEFFDTDGTTGFNQLVEVEINGTASAIFPQKSFALKAKGGLGDATFSYPVFPNSDRDEYRSLILRNSGNDWAATFFRDAAVTSLTRDLSDVGDIIQTPLLNGLDYRPCIAYLNGEYYGIYNLRERPDKRYVRVHFGLDDNEIDFIENQDEVKEGDITEWNNLYAELGTTDYSNETNYSQLAAKVDVDGYLDYAVFQIFVDNQDWPGNNVRRFRERTADGKWQWILYDLDFTFGLNTSQGWNTGYAGDNSLDRLLNPHPYNWPNPEWGARLFNNLLENDTWKAKFINRMADQINVLYQTERIDNRIDDIYESYLPEKDQHNALWSNLYNQSTSIAALKVFSQNRIPVVYQDFIEAFSEISGTSNITVNAIPSNRGAVNLSTLHLDEDDFSWTGIYFEGIDIPVIAVPNPGYVLDHWSGDLNGNTSATSININDDANITAHFELGSTSTAGIVINEINYNSSDAVNSGDWVEFHNPTLSPVDISGWYFQDEDGANFVFSNNTILEAGAYLVLVEDKTEFEPNYPNVTNFIGDFGSASIFEKIKLSNGGEILSLFNANGTLIDQVEYDDNDPWVDTPDGDGQTLQLMNPTLDNSIAQNWAGWDPTPGAINIGDVTPLLPQSISFNSISDKFTTDNDFDIVVSASSGLEVSLTVLSGPATISGNTVSLTGQTGTVTIQATQAGNAEYSAASPVSQTFNVEEENVELLPQTISFNGISDKFTTASDFEVIASSTSGLNVDVNIISGPATISGNTISLSGQTGTVTIQATQAGDAIYSAASPVTQTFEVIEQPISGEYCASTSEQPWHQWIANVSLGDLDNASGKNSYADFTNISTNLSKGDFHSLVLTVGFSYFTFDEYWTVWIDYNQNGIFEEPQELAYQAIQNAPANGTLTDAIAADVLIPASALNGTTRMRVSMKNGGYATPCETFLLGEVEDYTVNITGETSPSLTVNCPQNITVQLPTGVTSTEIDFDAPTATTTCPNLNTTITQTAGPNVGDVVPANTLITIFYVINDECDNSETCSFAFTAVSEIEQQDYCIPSSDFPWHDWIAGVTLSDLDNPSSKSSYSDFTDRTANLQQNAQYPITLTSGFSYYTHIENWSVWIDYNQNGVFSANELAFSTVQSAPPNGTTTETSSGNVNIPTSALLGSTRMRVAMSRDTPATPCGPISFGEYEDYSVNILPATAGLVHNPKLFFEASRTGVEVLLNWGTNTEYKNDYFEIEHSFDGQNFETLLEVESRREETYNMRTYREYDRPEKGRHFYRVKQVALDGGITYSNLQEIIFDLDENEMHVFPNPTSDFVYISAPSMNGLPANIQVSNGLGSPLETIQLERFPLTPTGVSVRDFKPGVYFISLEVDGFRMQTKRIIVAK